MYGFLLFARIFNGKFCKKLMIISTKTAITVGMDSAKTAFKKQQKQQEI